MSPCVDRVDDGPRGVWDCGFDEHFVVADGNGDGAQRPQGGNDLLNRHAGDVLQVPRHGQCREHDGQVSFDRVAGAVEDRAGPEVGYGNAE